MGVFQSPNNSSILGTAPRERLGIVSGMLAITRSLGQTIGIAVLGAVWAGRVFYYAGEKLTAGATAASPSSQAAGLHDTFLLIIPGFFIALCLAVWALFYERRQRTQQSFSAGFTASEKS